jgi:hypothetical protein
MSPHRNSDKSGIERGLFQFHDATSKGFQLSGRRHPIKSEIGAAASAGNDSVVSGKGLRRSPAKRQDILEFMFEFSTRVTFG